MNYLVETRQLVTHVERTYTQQLHLRGVTLPLLEAAVLRSLYETDGQKASAIARAVGRAPTSFTPNLDSLEAKGAIVRLPDPDDRRAVIIRLTDEGRALRQPITAAFEAAEKELEQTILDRLPLPDAARDAFAAHFADALAAS